MLHRRQLLPNPAVSHGRRIALVVTLLAAGCVIAGFRGPGAAARAQAAPSEGANEPAAAKSFSLDFVPNDAQFVLALRPAELAKIESLATLKDALQKLGILEPLNMPLENLEECKLVSGIDGPTKRSYSILVLRSRAPYEWTKVGDYAIGTKQEATENGQTYFKSTVEFVGRLSAYWLPDNRTIVLSRADLISNTFALRGGANEPSWAEAWKSVSGNALACMISPSALQEVIQQEGGRVSGELFSGVDGPLLFSGNAHTGGLFNIAGRAQCNSEAAAEKLKSRLSFSLDDLKRAMHGKLAEPSLLANAPAAEVVLRLLDATDLEAKDSAVLSRTSVSQEIGRNLAASLGPARAAARRALSVSKIKQFAIAMFNYHDLHKHFPSAVIMGPDGKTPHSWRVEMLPFLGRKDLYDRYKMDEPWDSEHNRKLIAEGAELFGVPSDQPNEDCGYFLLVGPGTAFDPSQPPPRIRDIIDGTSKTLSIVEARRPIAWTKPEDVEFDPQGPLPKLGGFFEGGYDAGYLDGHVEFLPETLDEKTFRALVSRGGREPIDIHPATSLPKFIERQ